MCSDHDSDRHDDSIENEIASWEAKQASLASFDRKKGSVPRD